MVSSLITFTISKLQNLQTNFYIFKSGFHSLTLKLSRKKKISVEYFGKYKKEVGGNN